VHICYMSYRDEKIIYRTLISRNITFSY